MSNPGVYILGLRQGRGEERTVVATATGIGVERQRIIEDGYGPPSMTERARYARHFGFADVDEFDANWRTKVVRVTKGETGGRIPVINLAPAGIARDYEEAYPNSGVGYAYIEAPPGVCGVNLFAFVIFGDSMEPDYPDGDFAICRPAAPSEIEEGAAVFVRFGSSRDHACTFKRCCAAGPMHVELRAINPKYASQIVAKEEIDRMAEVIATVAGKGTEIFGPDGEKERTEIWFDEPGT